MDRIVVVLPNWYGETLFATPFLRALRSLRPQAFIATLGWPQCGEILLHSPHVNELIDYDETNAHRTLLGKWRLIAELRARRFDAAFILRRSLSRSLVLALAGIPARIGFVNAKSGWLLTRRIRPATGALHKASTYFPLLGAAGPVPPVAPYDYAVSEAERGTAREWLQGRLAVNGRPVAVLHPGANWPHKRWAAERFAALGDRLSEVRRAHVVITGGPDDVALAESVARQMRQPPTVLAGQTTLRQLGVCLEQAQLVIANDTGILHLAAALRRPVVALYGPTSPALTGPLGDPQRTVVLHHPDCCPQIPCYRPDRPPHPGMNSITVDEAFAAACQMLEAGSWKLDVGNKPTPHV